MKRVIAILMTVLMLAFASNALAENETEAPAGEEPKALNVSMALLYEESTDTVMFSKAADRKNAPASMTKVMTAILVLEYDPELSGKTVVAPEAVSEKYCYWLDTDHLEAGEEVSVKDLMNYLLIASGNEAATTLAMYVAGTVEAFVDMMNEKAKELGMEKSFFMDPHGLSPLPQAVTAQDMLTLCLYAMKNATFREIVSTKNGIIPTSNKRSQPFRYSNSNRVMYPKSNPRYETEFTDDIIGIKTGYISSAGYNLSCCMVKDDLTFYSVVMQGREIDINGSTYYGHYLDTVELMTYARGYSKYSLAAGDEVTTLEVSRGKLLPLEAADDMAMLVREGTEPQMSMEVTSQLKGKIAKGDEIAVATYTDDFGNERTVKLVAASDMNVQGPLIYIIIGAAAVLILAAVVFLIKRRQTASTAAEAEEAAPESNDGAEA